MRQGSIEASDGEDARSRSGSDVDRREVVTLAQRQRTAQERAFEYLEHPAVPVGQVEDQVGERLVHRVEGQ